MAVSSTGGFLTEASPASRRSFLKGAVATGFSVAGLGLLSVPAFAQQPGAAADEIKTIMDIARTAEQLAVTFYSQVVGNAGSLALTGANLDAVKAALIEEQIHQQFFTAQGGDSLFDTFSFPDGPATFTDPVKFLNAQQQLEGLFDTAFLAVVKAATDPPIQNPALAQIAAQIAMVESEHRALGRRIGGSSPANNWAFAPVLIQSPSDAAAAVAQLGYLSPQAGNSYTYKPVDFTSADLKDVYQKILHLTPYRGDVNADGVVDIRDVIGALDSVVGENNLTAAERVAADVNGDGTLDVTDVTDILRQAIGLNQ